MHRKKTHTRVHTHEHAFTRAHRDARRRVPRRPSSSRVDPSALSRASLTHPLARVSPRRISSSCNISSLALSPASRVVHRQSSSSRPAPELDRSIDRFVRAFVVSHLRQVRFLEALSHHLSARVGVLEVAHTGDAPVRRAHLRARRRRGHDVRRGVTTARWRQSDSFVSHDSSIDRWDSWHDGDGLTED